MRGNSNSTKHLTANGGCIYQQTFDGKWRMYLSTNIWRQMEDVFINKHLTVMEDVFRILNIANGYTFLLLVHTSLVRSRCFSPTSRKSGGHYDVPDSGMVSFITPVCRSRIHDNSRSFLPYSGGNSYSSKHKRLFRAGGNPGSNNRRII